MRLGLFAMLLKNHPIGLLLLLLVRLLLLLLACMLQLWHLPLLLLTCILHMLRRHLSLLLLLLLNDLGVRLLLVRCLHYWRRRGHVGLNVTSTWLLLLLLHIWGMCIGTSRGALCRTLLRLHGGRVTILGLKYLTYRLMRLRFMRLRFMQLRLLTRLVHGTQ